MLVSTPSTTIAWVGTLQGVILICILTPNPLGERRDYVRLTVRRTAHTTNAHVDL